MILGRCLFSYSKPYIVRTPPPPILKWGEVTFDYFPRRGRGESEKLKKGWKYGAGAGLLKREGADTSPI